MNIKEKAKQGYDNAAEEWHKSRITDFSEDADNKLLKQNRPHLFIEKPAITSKIPDLKNKDVLCLGCGSGEECEFLLTKNPKKITGVDLSEKLIQIANHTYKNIEFLSMDAENLTFKPECFDFVYSSLMMDYFKSWDKVLTNVYKVLRKKGVFLFSTLHPVKWGARKINDADGKSLGALIGFEKDPTTGTCKIYGDYLNTTLHEEIWMKSISLSFYTKSISTMFHEIVSAGFSVTDIVEPKAILKAKEYDEVYWEINQRIPNFIIFECQKT
jgi:ubiquinone/menaquinone biosynthesis C-methylase UbiE